MVSDLKSDQHGRRKPAIYVEKIHSAFNQVNLLLFDRQKSHGPVENWSIFRNPHPWVFMQIFVGIPNLVSDLKFDQHSPRKK